MRTTIALWNVVGKAQDLLVVAAVPLHGHLNTNVGVLVGLTITHGVKNVGIQHLLAFVDEVHKSFDTTCAGEIIFFARALIF